MATNYSPTIVTDGAVFVGDALMPSTATSATKLYNRAGSDDGTMYAGTCLDFDGTDDRADISDASSLATSFGTTISCSVWVKSSQINTYKYLVDFDGTTDRWIFGWNTSSSGQIGYFNGTWRNFGTNPAADGSWHHLVLVVTASKQRLYIDGVQFGSELSSATSAMDGNGTTMYAPRGGFDGETADLRLYNVELSLAQIKEIYNNSKVILPANTGISNLKLWWPYSEGAGTTCFDGSGNGHNGTSTNDSSYLTGQTGCPQLVEGYNRPITFNVDASSTDYVDTGDVYAADEMTLVAWVNMSVVPSAAASNYPMMFGKRGTDTQRSYFLAFQKSSSKLYWEIKDAAGVYYIQYSTKTSWNANQWYHVAVNYVASTGIAKMYIDGVEDAGTFSPAQPWSLDPIPDTSATCRIGGGYYWFEGIINEAAIYNKALGATDIAALAATDANGGPLPPDLMTMSYSTSSTSSSNVIGYWRNDNDVTWTDLSGNGKTGTVTGSPPSLLFKQGINGSASTSTGRDHQGFPLLYENNGAVGFNGGVGTGAYIDLGTCPTIFEMAQTSKTTILAWIKVGKQSGENGIISAFSTTAASGWSLVTYQSVSNPRVSMLVSDGADGSAYWVQQAGTPLPEITADGKFHHVAVTIRRTSGTTTIYFHQDGVKGAEKTFTNEGGSTAWGNGRQLIIGRGAAGWGDFHGQIGNVQIYKRILSDSEIQQNYNAQKSRFI